MFGTVSLAGSLLVCARAQGKATSKRTVARRSVSASEQPLPCPTVSSPHMQASVASCSHTAPYATSENAPSLRRNGYRLQAPYYTQQQPIPDHTSHSLRTPSESCRPGSSRPPFSLHNEPAAAGGAPARPHRHDARPLAARSTAAPYDRDDQPAPPQRRAVFRTGYHTHSQCPYDREDLAVLPRPQQHTSTYPYATCAHSC